MSNNNEWKIPLYKIYTDDEDVELITKIIKRGTQWAIGPEIEEFENNIKDYVGCDYCLTLNSGYRRSRFYWKISCKISFGKG